MGKEVGNMTIEKSFPSGAYVITAIKDNHLVVRRYFGYTKKAATALFNKEMKHGH
jgi:hypothetical protein